MKEEMIIQYVEDVLKPYEVLNISYIDEYDYEIYLCEMEHGEEFWVLFQNQVCGLYRKCGIFNDIENVLAMHEDFEDTL